MGLIRLDHVKHDCQCCISCSLVLDQLTSYRSDPNRWCCNWSEALAASNTDGRVINNYREHNHWYQQQQQSLFLEYYVHPQPQPKLWTQFYRRRYVICMCFLCEVAFMIYSGVTDGTAHVWGEN